MKHRRKKPRKQPRCRICSPIRPLGNQSARKSLPDLKRDEDARDQERQVAKLQGPVGQ